MASGNRVIGGGRLYGWAFPDYSVPNRTGWQMVRGYVPILLMVAALAQAQQDASSQRALGGVSIPAELTTTVRAENAHRGDAVEFRTLEPVLITNGVVMPANAKLMGRIVGAAPRQGNKPSWLVLLVERAEWKKQSIPLHAFIAGKITISRVSQENSPPAGTTSSTTSPRRAARESVRAAAQDGLDMSPSTRMPQDAMGGSPPDLSTKAPPLKELRIVRDRDGIAYLFSSKSNVKLPSGTLLVLQNQAISGLARSGGEGPQPSRPPPQ